MKMRMAAALLAIIGGLAACEGITTGSEIARISLERAADGPEGAYAPVKLTLAPEMNPIAVNFRGEFSQNPAEFGKWNTYRATLSKDGVVAAARTINVNHPARDAQSSSPPPTQTVHTLFYVDVQSAGEYELTITPVKPVEITLSGPQVDARRNVQRPPQ